MSDERSALRVTELRPLDDAVCALSLSDGRKLRVSLGVVADFSLYSGRELEGEELDAFLDAAALDRTKERALRMIGARAMSEGEMFRRLVEKGETERHAAAAVARLVELHFLDDAAYAAMVVRHYAARGFGRRRIQDELYRRRVPRELWETALEELPQQEDTLDRLLRNRLRGKEADPAAWRKASDYLLRRGFSWEEIREAGERCRNSEEAYQ